MFRSVVALLLLLLFLSFPVQANEVIKLRSAVMPEKTRVVFDLRDRPDYELSRPDPYRVLLEIRNVENAGALPGLGRGDLGKIVQKVEVYRSGNTARYLFTMKWAVSPLLGYLEPQANYRHHRVYLDFLNSRISGAPRGRDDTAHAPAAASPAPATSNPSTSGTRPAPGGSGVSGSDPAAITVLTPEEARKKQEEIRQSNRRVMEEKARKEAEEARLRAEAKKKAEAERLRAEAEAKKKAEAERLRAEAEAKKKAEVERLRAEAEAKKKAEAERLRAEAETKKKAEAERLRAEAEAKKKAETERLRAEVEAKKKAEAERLRAEAEAKKKAEAERLQAEAEAKKKAEAERLRAEAEAKKKAEAERLRAEEARRRGSQTATVPSQTCTKKKIVIAIDPGHGGKDPGASGTKGTNEKTVTLAISRRLAKLVNTTRSMRAVLIRNSDVYVDLDARSEKARKANADILISIHADAATNKTAKGASVLVLNNDRAGRENRKVLNSSGKHDSLLGGAREVLEETAANGESNEYMKNMIIDLTSGKSRDAGYDLAGRIIKNLSTFARMHKFRPDERSLAVLKAPDIPSILVETGFISNPVEEKLLGSADYQKKIARAIFMSIQEHLADPRYKVEICH